MRQNTNNMLAIGAILLATISAPSAMADCRKRINLQPAVSGDWSGKAEVRHEGSQQRLKVSLDTPLPNGETLIVSANGLAVGTITVRLGDGELQLSNSDGKTLPQGANPVCSVTAITVVDSDGKTLLTGNFQ